jgi:nucleotide-binding universal stress UspA family protein
MLPIRTILYPTDFSPPSAYAFPLACALARDYGARLVVVHVIPPPRPTYSEFAPLEPDPNELAAEARAKLSELRPLDASVRVEYQVWEGAPAVEIMNVARQSHADLIVMGTHGRTGLGRLLLGSVAEEILRRAPCPVLTLKTPLPETAPAATPAPEEAVHA